MKLKYNVLIGALILATIAIGATKGDQAPFIDNGVVQCPADGGEALIPLLPNQNAIALRNFINDGGTAATVYIGKTGVTRFSGFPIKDQEVLSIDVVALTQNAVVTSGGPFADGGTQVTAGSLTPKIYCTTGLTDFKAQDLHILKVK